MSKQFPSVKVPLPKVHLPKDILPKDILSDTFKGTSVVTKWLPFICAGAAVGVSILALKELTKIKTEMVIVKNQQMNSTVKSDPLLTKKMEQLEEQLKKINEYLVNNNPKNPKNSKIIHNAVKTEIPKEVNIINEPEEGVEYEEVEVTDDEDSEDEN